jgi:hypothetical protein
VQTGDGDKWSWLCIEATVVSRPSAFSHTRCSQLHTGCCVATSAVMLVLLSTSPGCLPIHHSLSHHQHMLTPLCCAVLCFPYPLPPHKKLPSPRSQLWFTGGFNRWNHKRSLGPVKMRPPGPNGRHWQVRERDCKMLVAGLSVFYVEL